MTKPSTITRLGAGAHESRSDGVCLLEYVAWLAGEPHTDKPRCVSPVLATFGRHLNDVLPDDLRQQLEPLAQALIGTAQQPTADQARRRLAVDWLIRTWTPTWLTLAGLHEDAAALRTLAPIDSPRTLKAATTPLTAARTAARAAAWPATGTATGGATWDATWNATWDATGDATGDAARAAAWDATRNATWGAAWGAAWDAAWGAAWDATRTVARDAACGATRTVARTAAQAALAPTVRELHVSAIALYTHMTAIAEAS